MNQLPDETSEAQLHLVNILINRIQFNHSTIFRNFENHFSLFFFIDNLDEHLTRVMITLSCFTVHRKSSRRVKIHLAVTRYIVNIASIIWYRHRWVVVVQIDNEYSKTSNLEKT